MMVLRLIKSRLLSLTGTGLRRLNKNYQSSALQWRPSLTNKVTLLTSLQPPPTMCQFSHTCIKTSKNSIMHCKCKPLLPHTTRTAPNQYWVMALSIKFWLELLGRVLVVHQVLEAHQIIIVTWMVRIAVFQCNRDTNKIGLLLNNQSIRWNHLNKSFRTIQLTLMPHLMTSHTTQCIRHWSSLLLSRNKLVK